MWCFFILSTYSNSIIKRTLHSRLIGQKVCVKTRVIGQKVLLLMPMELVKY